MRCQNAIPDGETDMATLVRIVLWMAWSLAIGWLWREGSLGVMSALAAFGLGTALAAWRAGPGRRRRNELRYVEMAKQPVA